MGAQARIVELLEELARDPVGLSDATHTPYPIHCQLFKFEIDSAGEERAMVAVFQFAANETEIWILGIVDQPVGGWAV